MESLTTTRADLESIVAKAVEAAVEAAIKVVREEFNRTCKIILSILKIELLLKN